MKAVVISAGGLHLGYVGCYGSDWFATPHLDELAARAAVFDQHYSDQPDVQAARLAWRSGVYHLPTGGGGAKEIATADLTSLFRQHKITLAFVGGPVASTSSDFGSDWDIVERRSRERAARAIDETVKLAAKTVRRLARKDRWLLWIDLPRLTPPWDVRPELLDFYFSSPRGQEEEEDEAGSVAERLDPLLEPAMDTMDAADESTILRLQQTYAAAVRQCDEGIGGVLDLLSEARLGDESMVLFTADRGLPLGEHGVVGEVRPWLHEELMHLPLIVRLPADAQAGVRSSALTQPIDLLPTLADAFGVAMPPVHGRSLMPLVREEVQEVRGYACAGLRMGPALEWALRTPQWSFLLPIQREEKAKRAAQLYVKPDDRWEVNNVAQHQHELVEELEKVLHAFVEATSKGGSLEPPPLPNLDKIRELQPAAEGPRPE